MYAGCVWGGCLLALLTGRRGALIDSPVRSVVAWSLALSRDANAKQIGFGSLAVWFPVTSHIPLISQSMPLAVSLEEKQVPGYWRKESFL